MRRKRTRKDEDEAAAAVAAVADAIRKEEELAAQIAAAGAGAKGEDGSPAAAGGNRKLVKEVQNSKRRRKSLKLELAKHHKELEELEKQRKEMEEEDRKRHAETHWTCPYCTFDDNENSVEICAVCAKTKPEGIVENEWTDDLKHDGVGEQLVDETWTCTWCTFSGNSVDERVCVVGFVFLVFCFSSFLFFSLLFFSFLFSLLFSSLLFSSLLPSPIVSHMPSPLQICAKTRQEVDAATENKHKHRGNKKKVDAIEAIVDVGEIQLEEERWECRWCTSRNAMEHNVCQTCFKSKAGGSGGGGGGSGGSAGAGAGGARAAAMTGWTCAWCTSINTEDAKHCCVCAKSKGMSPEVFV